MSIWSRPHTPSNSAKSEQDVWIIGLEEFSVDIIPKRYHFAESKLNVRKYIQNISAPLKRVNHWVDFFSTPYRGWVYKWEFCLSILLSVRLSVITSYFLYSDSKLTQPSPVDLSHATSPDGIQWHWIPMSPIHVSHARQSTSPLPSQLVTLWTGSYHRAFPSEINLTFLDVIASI